MATLLPPTSPLRLSRQQCPHVSGLPTPKSTGPSATASRTTHLPRLLCQALTPPGAAPSEQRPLAPSPQRPRPPPRRVPPSLPLHLLTPLAPLALPPLALASVEELLQPLPDPPADPSPLVLGAAGVGVAGLAYGVVRAGAYFRLQYAAAQVLARYVPRGGAKVLDLNVATGRHLFYLPNDASHVVGLNPTLDPQVVRAQAVSAGVELDFVGTQKASKSGAPETPDALLKALQRMPAASYDAVVSIGGVFSGLAKAAASKDSPASLRLLYGSLVREIARVLRPGRPFVFLEKVASSSAGNESPVFFMSEADADYFERIDWDYILNWIDKHVVGVAVVSK